ncbi:SpoIIE family protein phosphatase [Ramlibacter sp. RBP-2]|uniref:SpoIIE family protein phosphatase n=1 Tax=Ramlibacter lithotrophicus TaxID=2606681 RepID=A0A7X6I4Q9_9BURK|nr:ATP-binding protein [Ramlibacter lithotrophicus]NKE64435.1 SpoIIE family protein phosphatase [Ramlibacter lithotrophicus]
MIAGWVHVAFPVDDASRIGEARRHAAAQARDLGWDEVDAGRLALVVTELGSNLLRHANKGRLLVAARPQSGEIEVLAIDKGPGISNVAQCLGDGFSTGSTPGTGLGAVRRLADVFDIHSSVPQGTVVLARLARQRLLPARGRGLELGAVAVCAPGEIVCGDGWTASLDGGRAAVLLADGLGHGPEAAAAAQAAVDVFARDPHGDLRATLEEAHRELRSTRGAAVTALQADGADGSIRSAGAGNITVRIVAGDHDRTLLSQHGTIGVQMRRLQEVRADWPPHAAIVLYSDGVEGRWAPQLIHPLLAHDPALIAAVLVRDHFRGRDDATVVVLRRKG